MLESDFDVVTLLYPLYDVRHFTFSWYYSVHIHTLAYPYMHVSANSFHLKSEKKWLEQFMNEVRNSWKVVFHYCWRVGVQKKTCHRRILIFIYTQRLIWSGPCRSIIKINVYSPTAWVMTNHFTEQLIFYDEDRYPPPYSTKSSKHGHLDTVLWPVSQRKLFWTARNDLFHFVRSDVNNWNGENELSHAGMRSNEGFFELSKDEAILNSNYTYNSTYIRKN